jgi:hypothetical protein
MSRRLKEKSLFQDGDSPTISQFPPFHLFPQKALLSARLFVLEIKLCYADRQRPDSLLSTANEQ